MLGIFIFLFFSFSTNFLIVYLINVWLSSVSKDNLGQMWSRLVVTLNRAWACPVRSRWGWGVQCVPLALPFSLLFLSGWCWPHSKMPMFGSQDLIKHGLLMGLMTSALCSQTNATQEGYCWPSCSLSINYICLCQINCMELFAEDSEAVDSGWGVGRMRLW